MSITKQDNLNFNHEFPVGDRNHDHEIQFNEYGMAIGAGTISWDEISRAYSELFCRDIVNDVVWMTPRQAAEIDSETIVLPKEAVGFFDEFTFVVGDTVPVMAASYTLIADMGDKVRLHRINP